MNRIKEVLEERGIKQTWLAERLGESFRMPSLYPMSCSASRSPRVWRISSRNNVTERLQFLSGQQRMASMPNCPCFRFMAIKTNCGLCTPSFVPVVIRLRVALVHGIFLGHLLAIRCYVSPRLPTAEHVREPSPFQSHFLSQMLHLLPREHVGILIELLAGSFIYILKVAMLLIGQVILLGKSFSFVVINFEFFKCDNKSFFSLCKDFAHQKILSTGNSNKPSYSI